MSLKDRFETELKAALKRGDKARLSVIRMIKSAVQYEEIAHRNKLEDQDIQRVLASLQKQRKESIQQFESGGREDLAAKEKAELAIISEFLPRELSPEELKLEVTRAIDEAGAQGMKDLGKVMKILMPRITGRAEGKTVNEMVRALLSSKG